MNKNKQYSEAKIWEVLKEYNSGVGALEVCRKHNINILNQNYQRSK